MDLFVHDLESDKIRNHLTILLKCLNKATSLIQLPYVEKVPKKNQHFRVLLEVIEKEHRNILVHKVLIEKHKEEQEHQMIEMVCCHFLFLLVWNPFISQFIGDSLW